MKIIKMIVMIAFTLFFLIFAFQNNIPVNVRLFKFNIASDMPLFIVLIVVFLIGFLWGRISAWFSSVFHEKIKSKKNNQK